MRRNNNFRLSEVILGLRDEYKKTAIELENLKKHFKLEDGVTSEVGIYSYPEFSKEDPEKIIMIHSVMVIELTKKLNLLERILKTISLNDLSYDQVYHYVSNYRKNHYRVNDKSLLEFVNESKFKRDCDTIMLNDFNYGLIDKYVKANQEGLNVKLGHNGIFAVTDLRSATQPVIGVDYYAGNDQLVMNNYNDDPMFVTKSKDLLDTQLPCDIIDDGLAYIIRNNPISEYPIEFEGLDNSKFEQRFDLEVKSDYVLAKRAN